MAGSEIKVTPDAVMAAIEQIASLRERLANAREGVGLDQSKGPAAGSVVELSRQVTSLSRAVDALLASDQKRLADGLVAFEGADSSLAQMLAGLSGASRIEEG